jgi:DNA-binding transcriptional LysR family regulator
MQWEDRIGRRLKLRDVHILLAVAQWGSMGRAAERLAVSHPVVSKTVADLEHALGVRLLERGRHGAEPTAHGRAVIKHGLAAFDELKQCVEEIAFLNDPTAGEVRIAGTEPMVAGLLPIVIDRLCRRHPRVAVHVTQVYSTPDFYQGLRERSVDFVIGRLLSRAVDRDLEAEVLFHDPILIVAGAGNPWARRRNIELAELVNERWILPRPDTAVGALIAETFRSCGLDVPRPAVIGNSIHMNNALLSAGHFLAMHPRSLVELNVGRQPIKILPVKLTPQRGPVGIVKLKGRTVSPVARLFIDAIRQVAKPLAA